MVMGALLGRDLLREAWGEKQGRLSGLGVGVEVVMRYL